jgi:hypothetical protein
MNYLKDFSLLKLSRCDLHDNGLVLGGEQIAFGGWECRPEI